MTTPTCTCVRHADGSVTTFLCSVHADTDPCLTMSHVTGRRRTGTIRRGVCTACGHTDPNRPLCSDHYAARHGYDPDMGDDGSWFQPGTCAVCGKDGTVFRVTR